MATVDFQQHIETCLSGHFMIDFYMGAVTESSTLLKRGDSG